jgi:hypothetical protein
LHYSFLISLVSNTLSNYPIILAFVLKVSIYYLMMRTYLKISIISVPDGVPPSSSSNVASMVESTPSSRKQMVVNIMQHDAFVPSLIHKNITQFPGGVRSRLRKDGNIDSDKCGSVGCDQPIWPHEAGDVPSTVSQNIMQLPRGVLLRLQEADNGYGDECGTPQWDRTF